MTGTTCGDLTRYPVVMRVTLYRLVNKLAWLRAPGKGCSGWVKEVNFPFSLHQQVSQQDSSRKQPELAHTGRRMVEQDEEEEGGARYRMETW